MINVNQITSRLAQMPDQALQQYAAMHKNDPYTMALALAESNRRKQMRQGAQMQAPQQPKVVDQEIAGMAQAMPEDVGIGQLPAPNMQRMAEGGIVAFANEGYVDPAFTFGIESEYGGLSPLQKAPLTPAQLARLKLEKEREKNMAASRAYGSNLRPTALDSRLGLPPALGGILGATPPAQTVGSLPNMPPATGAATPPSGLPPPSKLPRPPSAAAPAPAPGITALATDPTKLRAEYEALQGTAPTTTPYDARIKEITEGEVRAKREGLEQLESDIQNAGEAFKDREARLGKRKEKLDTQEDKLPYMALMEAGLAIMSGTSPNALANIGAGGAIGMKSYAAGIDKLTDARDKLDDAYGKIEEFRRNESMMNAKERRAAKADITSAELNGKKVALAALQDNWKMKREDANKVWTALESNRKTLFEQQQENARTAQREGGAFARAKAALPQTLYETLGAAKPDSALMKGYNMAKSQEEMARMYDLYTKQASDYAKGPEFTSKYPTFQTYMQEFRNAMGSNTGGGILNQVPENVPVLPYKK
jgi:predicted nuclease with TOPRIM domain